MEYIGNDQKRVGTALIIGGLVCFTMGILLLCDRLLLLIGHICFLAGVSYLVGTFTMITFFMRPSKVQGSVCYFIGMFFLLVNWPILGTFLQLAGLFYMFRGFIPQLYSSSKYLPGIGPYLCSSVFLNNLVATISGKKTGPEV